MVADDTALDPRGPSTHRSTFLEFLATAQIDPARGGYELPSTPFAFVLAPELRGRIEPTFVPADVITRTDVHNWKLKVTPINKVQGWENATEATAIQRPKPGL